MKTYKEIPNWVKQMMFCNGCGKKRLGRDVKVDTNFCVNCHKELLNNVPF